MFLLPGGQAILKRVILPLVWGQAILLNQIILDQQAIQGIILAWLLRQGHPISQQGYIFPGGQVILSRIILLRLVWDQAILLK
jgi:hypothetical protein